MLPDVQPVTKLKQNQFKTLYVTYSLVLSQWFASWLQYGSLYILTIGSTFGVFRMHFIYAL